MSPSGFVCFSTTIFECLVFVKVQVTVSPGSTLNVAWRFATLPEEFWSEQLIEVSVQPAFAASVDTYWPAATPCEIVPLFTEIAPAGVPEKSNVSVPPTMTFLTITWPSFEFVKVHFTVSPAASAIELGAEPSSQVAEASDQPAGTVSLTEYVPGASAAEVFCCPSASWKAAP